MCVRRVKLTNVGFVCYCEEKLIESRLIDPGLADVIKGASRKESVKILL